MKRVVEQLSKNDKDQIDAEKLIAALINTELNFDEIYKTIKGT